MDIFTIIESKTIDLINNTFNDEMIKETFKKQLQVSHVIPIRYRVLSGLFQSLNIKFGDFLEDLTKDFINNSPEYTVVSKITRHDQHTTNEELVNNQTRGISGGKKTSFIISEKCLSIIHKYIDDCTSKDSDITTLSARYNKFLNDIKKQIELEKQKPNTYPVKTFDNDVDILFLKNKNNDFYYIELKKEDNHDSGKDKDIYAKLMKTFVCLLYEAYGINKEDGKFEIKSLTPILMFWGSVKKKNRFIPEETNVYDGVKFFNNFLSIDFREINSDMYKVSTSTQIEIATQNAANKILQYSNTELLKCIDEIFLASDKYKVYNKRIKTYNAIIENIELYDKSHGSQKEKVNVKLDKMLSKISFPFSSPDHSVIKQELSDAIRILEDELLIYKNEDLHYSIFDIKTE